MQIPWKIVWCNQLSNRQASTRASNCSDNVFWFLALLHQHQFQAVKKRANYLLFATQEQKPDKMQRFILCTQEEEEKRKEQNEANICSNWQFDYHTMILSCICAWFRTIRRVILHCLHPLRVPWTYWMNSNRTHSSIVSNQCENIHRDLIRSSNILTKWISINYLLQECINWRGYFLNFPTIKKMAKSLMKWKTQKEKKNT